jgi:histidine triad (HIT) family protein
VTGTCIFCDIAAGRVSAHVVIDQPAVVAFLDRRPLFHGHTLVVPRPHHELLADLPQGLVAPLFTVVQRLSAAMVDGLGADGSFVANNNTVSQSVPHVHVHVVPRRRKDGLRGFFWPRQRYDNEEQAAEVARRLRSAVEGPS